MVLSNSVPTTHPNPYRLGIIGGYPKRFKQRANLVSYKQEIERQIPTWVNHTLSSNGVFTSVADGGWWPTNGAAYTTNMLPRWTVTGLLDHVGAPTNYLDVTPWFNLHKVSNGWAYMRPLVSNLYVDFSHSDTILGLNYPDRDSRVQSVVGIYTAKVPAVGSFSSIETNTWTLARSLLISQIESDPVYGVTNVSIQNTLPENIWNPNFLGITNNNPISVQPIKMSARSRWGYMVSQHIWKHRPHHGRTYGSFRKQDGGEAYWDFTGGIAPTNDVTYFFEDTGTQTTNEVKTFFPHPITPFELIPDPFFHVDPYIEGVKIAQWLDWVLHVQDYDFHYGP